MPHLRCQLAQLGPNQRNTMKNGDGARARGERPGYGVAAAVVAVLTLCFDVV